MEKEYESVYIFQSTHWHTQGHLENLILLGLFGLDTHHRGYHLGRPS